MFRGRMHAPKNSPLVFGISRFTKVPAARESSHSSLEVAQRSRVFTLTIVRWPADLLRLRSEDDARPTRDRKDRVMERRPSMNWAELQPLAALAYLTAIILLIASGLAVGDMTAALLASSGALVVGFGAFQRDFRV
jgi:hypothetical protein